MEQKPATDSRTHEALRQASGDYPWIEDAIRYLDQHAEDQPELEAIAAHLGVSSFHLQRVFSRWVGISPKRFLQFLTKERARELLAESDSLLDATYDLGLSSPSRLHDLFVTCEAVTPGEYRRRGEDLEIRWGTHPSPFGEVLVGATDRGICWLSFTGPKGRRWCLEEMEQSWPRASLREDPRVTSSLTARIFSGFRPDGDRSLHLLVQGTNFQIKVWEALLQIPPGSVTTYGRIADTVGQPDAQRAVGSAVGRNPISFLIPCHRVIRSTGAFGQYGSGTERKRAILAWESARQETSRKESA